MCQDGAPLVRTVNVFRAKHHLPACRHAPGRMEDVVIIAPFVDLGPFASLVCLVSVKYDTGRSYGLRSFRIQLANSNYAFELGAAPRIGMHHVDTSVFIPKRTSVNQSFGRLH